MPKDEFERLKKRPVVEIFKENVDSIAAWADFSFMAEGRTLKLFLHGESIGYRLGAQGTLEMENPAQRRNELLEIAGFILEGDKEPLIYNDHGELVNAWIELHRSFGVRLSDDEIDALNIDEPEDNESED